MKKTGISIIFVLVAAFTLAMSVGAVSATAPIPTVNVDCNVAYFSEGIDALEGCEIELTLDSPESARYRAVYDLKNCSSERKVVKVMQPYRYGTQCDLTADNKNITSTVRRSYNDDYFNVDIEASAKSLSDEFKEIDFLRPDTPVYKTDYKVYLSNVPTGIACFYFRGIGATHFVFTDGAGCVEDKNDIECYVSVFRGAKISVYQIGNRLEPKIAFFTNLYNNEKTSGSAEKLSEEQMTFREFVASFNDGDAAEVDYYNAVINSFRDSTRYHYDYEFDLYIRNRLLNWSCFDIPLEVGEKTRLEVAGNFLNVDNFYEEAYIYYINFYPSFPMPVSVKIDSLYDIYISADDVQKNGDGHYNCMADDANGFSVNVDYGVDDMVPLIKFLVGFLGRIFAIPIALVCAKFISKKILRKKTELTPTH